jgi:hypothetical protein
MDEGPNLSEILDFHEHHDDDNGQPMNVCNSVSVGV